MGRLDSFVSQMLEINLFLTNGDLRRHILMTAEV